MCPFGAGVSGRYGTAVQMQVMTVPNAVAQLVVSKHMALACSALVRCVTQCRASHSRLLQLCTSTAVAGWDGMHTCGHAMACRGCMHR